jgi:hypothetical protein
MSRTMIGELMARDGFVFDSTNWTIEKENKLIGVMFEYMLANGYTKKQANNTMSLDEDYIGDNLEMLPRI